MTLTFVTNVGRWHHYYVKSHVNLVNVSSNVENLAFGVLVTKVSVTNALEGDRCPR